MKPINASSNAFASLRSKASSLPRFGRDKKAKQVPEPDIHETIHSKTIQPVTESTPTLQPFDIPRPVHAKKTQATSPPVNVPIPVLQPIDIPRPVHAKPSQQATQQVAAPAPAPTLAPILQPFDIPRPVHAKKSSGKSPTKKDKSSPAPVPAPTQPQPAANTPTQLPNSTTTTTTISYPPPLTHPLFPTPPVLGPPTLKSSVQTALLQLISHILTTIGILFLLLAYLLHTLKRLIMRPFSSSPPRPFQAEESRRAEIRKIDSLAWTKLEIQRKSKFPDIAAASDVEANAGAAAVAGKDGYVPTVGGKDAFVVDVGYYARRVGLDSEEVKVQTEDGFVLDLWHVFDPREYTPLSRVQRMVRGPECVDDIRRPSREMAESEKGKEAGEKKQKYPVLMMPGLMQSSGVYCTNDDHSLAFWLCKQGYDVWLGNNRCGFKPRHVEFKKGDPRMWNWNITHMATLDLPALTARVLSETCSPTLGLIAHSQGTTQTLIALSKHQRPTLSTKISVFCALAPAAYAGPLLNTHPFKFLRLLPLPLFRLTLGRKSFLPFLSQLNHIQGHIPQHWIGAASYQVYNYIFGWGDAKWDCGVRDRGFMFAPILMSALAMQWWLSREGFAHHGCILSSREQVEREVEEDLLQDYFRGGEARIGEDFARELLEKHVREPREPESWFHDGVSDEPGSRPPPMAFWIAGEDTICDGRELLNRFERGREPGVRVLVEGGKNVVEGYSHLDVVWACDVIEKVGHGVRGAIWRTLGAEARERYRMPKGVEGVEAWVDDRVFGGGLGKREGSTDLEDRDSDKETVREKDSEAGGKRVGDKEMAT
ncbi:putative ab-hydrolase associated lipase [Cadophora sp. MPI-SDFR-AT-0126]|nr:putative ab-hydrolase associated lipase [Leotiomycetes sp. MPI-SDFR-AT-0126]